MLTAFRNAVSYAGKSPRMKMGEEKNGGIAMEIVVMCSVKILLA